MEEHKLTRTQLTTVLLVMFFSGTALGVIYGQMKAEVTKIQFSTVDANTCLAEGLGKKFMLIDVTEELEGALTPEEVEGPAHLSPSGDVERSSR